MTAFRVPDPPRKLSRTRGLPRGATLLTTAAVTALVLGALAPLPSAPAAGTNAAGTGPAGTQPHALTPQDPTPQASTPLAPTSRTRPPQTRPPRTEVDPTAAQAAVNAYAAPSAVAWFDPADPTTRVRVWANDSAAHEIASLSKLVTALVGQERAPLRQGEAGPSYTWSEADAQRQAAFAAEGAVITPIPVGTQVSRHNMLALALIASANDFASAYAYSLFGDDAGFSAAVSDWAKRHGLTTLTLREPTGMDERNVASAADIARISQLALADPVLRELVATEAITLPWENEATGEPVGEIRNSNPLLGKLPDVIGLKTGLTETAGYSLAAAARGGPLGETAIRISVVLGRDSAATRTDDAAAQLAALTAASSAADQRGSDTGLSSNTGRTPGALFTPFPALSL